MSTYQFHVAQQRLNLVKWHAHEIIGCKREQVHRVVESLSSPGTFVITTHRDGRVTHHEWRVPSQEEIDQAVTYPAPTPQPETKPAPTFVKPSPYNESGTVLWETPASLLAPEEFVLDGDVFLEDISATSPEKAESSVISAPEEPRLAEGLNETPTAPESPAAANPAPRRRGRPKKSN